jgi:hypothetical protein
MSRLRWLLVIVLLSSSCLRRYGGGLLLAGLFGVVGGCKTDWPDSPGRQDAAGKEGPSRMRAYVVPDASPPRREDFDPGVLVGKSWEEACGIIRANGWLCEVVTDQPVGVPTDIDYPSRHSSRRRVVDTVWVAVTVENGKVVKAHIEGEL